MIMSSPELRPSPSPESRRFYLSHAESCLAAAADTTDAAARRLHEEECKLWLMLARQRVAIEDSLRSFQEAPPI